MLIIKIESFEVFLFCLKKGSNLRKSHSPTSNLLLPHILLCTYIPYSLFRRVGGGGEGAGKTNIQFTSRLVGL